MRQRKSTRLIGCLLGVCLLGLILGCGGGDGGLGAIATIALFQQAGGALPARVNVGDTLELSGVAKDSQGRVVDAIFTWALTGNIGTISPRGKTAFFTATQVGSGTITASANGKTGTHAIAVEGGGAASQVLVSPSPQSVGKGQTQQFTAAALDANGAPVSATFTWGVTGNVGTVDANGLFTATHLGQGTVTATADGQTGSAQVTVPVNVAPDGGAYDPGGTDNQQALLVASQALGVGDGTIGEHQLLALSALLDQLGEGPPPGGGVGSRLRVGSLWPPERLYRLVHTRPLRSRAPIDETINGVRFTGDSAQSGDRVAVTLQGTSGDGTDLDITDVYSVNPDDFTRQLRVAGTLMVDGVAVEYDVAVDLDAQGHGTGMFDIAAPGSDTLGYRANLGISGSSWVGEEAVTRADGFWTQTVFSATFDGFGGLTAGDFDFSASNDFTGDFALHPDGIGEGQVKNDASTVVASLETDENGDLRVTYTDGSGSDVVVW